MNPVSDHVNQRNEFWVPTRFDSDFLDPSFRLCRLYVQTLQTLCSDFADLRSEVADLCSDFADSCSDFADLCLDLIR